jgi:dolichol-phosphate mannosyltransferase
LFYGGFLAMLQLRMTTASRDQMSRPLIVAVVPCFRERAHILDVLQAFDDSVGKIIVVDDACPEGTGHFVAENCKDPRVEVVFHETNRGVGGATLTGYGRALELGADIIVKLDGDGQMDPKFIANLVRPLLDGRADYSKGNRFYRLDGVTGMPPLRIAGNLALSFACKASSGYWKIFDPTNGFTAIDSRVAVLLPLHRIDRGYFFESDILMHLYLLRAQVADVPMRAVYGKEQSGIRIPSILGPFLWKHLRNFARRVVYTYYLRDFSIASIELVVGMAFFLFGTLFGTANWYHSALIGVPTATGIIVLCAVTFVLGFYLLMGFLNFDIQNQPDTPLSRSL